MSDPLSRRLFLQLLGAAGAAASVPLVAEAAVAEVTPVLDAGKLIVDRDVQIFVGNVWRSLGSLVEVEVSHDAIPISSAFRDGPRLTRRGPTTTTLKVEAFERDADLEEHLCSYDPVPTRVFVDGSWLVTDMRVNSSRVRINCDMPMLVSYEAVGCGEVRLYPGSELPPDPV